MLTDAHMIAIAEAVARWFELGGIAVIVAGSVFAFVGGAVMATRGGARGDVLPHFRRTLGRSILTGLELLVAADIIRTVAIEPTLDNVIVLGLIVLIRTFLSWSLEVEIEGRWPWQGKASG